MIAIFSAKSTISHDVPNDASFFLINRNGSFLHLSSHADSKYQGFFIAKNSRLFRIIEDIWPVNSLAPSQTSITLYSVQRTRGHLLEKFFVPENTNSLVYELSEPHLVHLFLDVKDAYDAREWGRSYSFSVEKGCAIIEFTKKSSFNEDNSNDVKEFSFFIAVKSDSLPEFVGHWIKRNYQFDIKRSNPPYNRHVYDSLRSVSRKIVFSVNEDKAAAIKEAQTVYTSYSSLVAYAKKHSERFFGKNTALSFAEKSFDSLMVDGRLVAGHPWFFQPWSRDEAIGVRGLILLGREAEAKKILFTQLNSVLADGRTPYISGSDKSCADGIGWVALRLKELGKLKKLAHSEKKIIASSLEKAVAALRKNFESDLLIYNRPLETWMDTKEGSDTREGFRIEIQCLQLAIYDFLFSLTKKQQWKELRDSMSAKVKSAFWNGKILADGKDDWTIRPNVFLASYIYPELLSPKEWSICFSNSLTPLWLNWGGLSTIDKSHQLFKKEHSGEPPISYHRGDSWFWINNIAAMVMHRVDKKLFAKQIDSIFHASTNEILWSGALGAHAELSSASEMRSEGCLSQLWSNSTYMELCHEIGKR